MAEFLVSLLVASSPNCKVTHAIKRRDRNSAILYAREWLKLSRRSTRLIGLFYDRWTVERVHQDGQVSDVDAAQWTEIDETVEVELRSTIKPAKKAARARRIVGIEGLGKRAVKARTARGHDNSDTAVAVRRSTPARQFDYLRNRIEQIKAESRQKDNS